MFITYVDKYLAELYSIERYTDSYFTTEKNPEEFSIIYTNIVHLFSPLRPFILSDINLFVNEFCM